MTKERQPEHLTKEYQSGLVMPQRECKGCGVTFQQLYVNQRFHDVPCREDATARSQRAKALERPKWKASDLECQGCGVVFLPENAVQRFHDVPCRVDATDRNRRAKALARSGWKASERKCEGCRVVFLPQNAVQIYHDARCGYAETLRQRQMIRHIKKDEIRRAAEALEKKEAERRAESDRFMGRLVEAVVYEATVRIMEPLMALAEKEAIAEGYEFEVIPDGHPRWAEWGDLHHSSAWNRKGKDFNVGGRQEKVSGFGLDGISHFVPPS